MFNFTLNRGRMFSLAYETEKLGRDVNVSHTFHNDLLPFTEIQAKSEIASELMVRVSIRNFDIVNIDNLFKILFVPGYCRSKYYYVKIKSQ